MTLVREYAQGLNRLVWGLPTGGFDPARHADLAACAAAELSEEARLAGGRWVELVPPEHPGIGETKWCANRFRPYLVVDPRPDAAPGGRDAEEWIQVQRVPLGRLRALMRGGDMLLPSLATCWLALERLAELGCIGGGGGGEGGGGSAAAGGNEQVT